MSRYGLSFYVDIITYAGAKLGYPGKSEGNNSEYDKFDSISLNEIIWIST